MDVSNDSKDKVTQLATGFFPPEILVDGVRYRSRWVEPRLRNETKPRIIQPGVKSRGSEFTLGRNWVGVEDTKEIELTPGPHVVTAVLYASQRDAPGGDRKVRVLSNSIELDGEGRAVGFRNVTIRILGGAEKKALKGLELTVNPVPTRWRKSLTATTREDGSAPFSLHPATYEIGLRSPKELPYLRTEAEQARGGPYRRNYRRQDAE